ncbi:MAG TPA: hypothetical protein VD887_00680 [Allosphingosinicella sp.]|nr:hypothetical protein [Allosphingosinicella sp.]
MSAAPETVEGNELAFFFQTNEPIPAKPLLDFLYEVERIARSRRYLGSDAVVEIVEVITGTKLVRLSFGKKIAFAGAAFAGASAAAAVAQLGIDLAGRMQQPTGRLAESLARMCLDHGVAECVITTQEGRVQISRDEIQAVAMLRDRRNARETVRVVPTPRAKPALADEPLLARRIEEIREAVPRGASDGRIYTLVGQLLPPKAGSRDWHFRSQSGTVYIARGLRPERANLPPDNTVVIRAETWGRDRDFTVLNVVDVFEPEDP